MTHPIDRREFLRASGLVVLGAAAAACSSGNGDSPGGETLADLTKGKTNSMTVASVQPSLARPNDRLSIGLVSQQGTPMSGGTATAWLARTRTEKASKLALQYHGDGYEGRGTYIARFTFPADGEWLMYVEARPEGAAKTLTGATTLRVGERIGAPTGPKQPIPGEKAVSVATPTLANARGVNPICTRVNPTTRKRERCSMHAISLDQALKSGKPTVLSIGTPAFCETQYCGPLVDQVMKVQAATDKSKINFVHVELYRDDKDAPATKNLSPGATAWRIEAEPVVYYIDASNTIAEWTIGSSDAAEISQIVSGIL